MKKDKNTKQNTATETTSGPDALFEIYEKIPGYSAKAVEKLQKLCGPRYIDLLLHMPTGIMNRKFIEDAATAKTDELVVFKIKTGVHRAGHGRQPYRVQAMSAETPLELLFFNKGRWIASAYEEGKEIYVCGTVESTLTGIQMVHPEVLPLSKKIDEISGSFPLYPLSAGVTQNMVRKAIGISLVKLKEINITDWITKDLRSKNGFENFKDSLKNVHTPQAGEAVDDPQHPARKRLAFDELYCWQIALNKAREENKSLPGITQKEQTYKEGFLNNLPFRLTGDQQDVLKDIEADMCDSEPMLRLVQGDVGSGKTVVAFAALLQSVASGNQAVMMAPTEVLAVQHFQNAKQLLEPLGITVALLTGKQKAKEKRELKAGLKEGDIQIVIGTHALIQEDVEFKKVGLVVVDEQHRFGVKQRLALTKQKETPDLLAMTATPIPRTLALTFYGDMDISIIREKPPGRTPINTTVMPIEKVGDIAVSLGRIINKNEQAYWVCPLVEESEKSDLAAATDRVETLKQIYGDKVALLHGRMKGQEKRDILNTFKEGETKILVSTTVIEVGVDVPQATVMIIEHAERFGLSQLHQLRGRVGRGAITSNCVLLYGHPLSHYAQERLDIIRKSDDGFVLAEKDLDLRGPGEALGTQQSGRFITRVANFVAHKELISAARDLARNSSDTDETSLKLLMKIFNKEQAATLLKAG